MATTTTSTFLGLDLKDFLKGVVMAVLVPVITIITQSLDAGTLTFNWVSIGIAALSGFLGYLVKNFLTPSSVSIQNITKAEVKAVKEGEAVATIVPKNAN